MAICLIGINWPTKKPQLGFTYLGVLFAVAIVAIGLLMVSETWSKTAQRQREAERVWVLDQYANALQSYYNASPGSVRTFPQSLDDLLLDRRHLSVLRHLRRLYKTTCNPEVNDMTIPQYSNETNQAFIQCGENRRSLPIVPH